MDGVKGHGAWVMKQEKAKSVAALFHAICLCSCHDWLK
jgi:hypothetical protein